MTSRAGAWPRTGTDSHVVKEVHHRIKNHLQSTVGLMRQHMLERDESSEVLAKAISHILSIAAVHGIQARMQEDSIYLCSIVEEIVRASRRACSVPIRFPGSRRLFALDSTRAVSVALIVNELITKAVKYTSPASDARIVIDIEHDGDDVVLTVTNSPARLPVDFNLQWGMALGACLLLVHTLLAHLVAVLEIEQRSGEISARLRLMRTQPASASQQCADRDTCRHGRLIDCIARATSILRSTES